jgi:ABC-type glutathione transport system ATPase component
MCIVARVDRSLEVAEGETILQAVSLSKEFSGGGAFSRHKADRKTLAVDNVSFDLRKGETLAVVGESGSGKSTLARMLLNLIEPTSGSVLYQGRDLTKLHARQMRDVRRHLQMIFQDPYSSLHPTHTIFEIVSEGWRIHRGVERPQNYRHRVDQLLEQVGLPSAYARMYPARLSGGERQRVAIARALALSPETLVLDEPVSSLDVSIQAQVIKLLMTLQEELGLTYVFISHDLALVRVVADRVIVMSAGRVVEFGETEDVYTRPKSDYTRSLLESSPSVLVERLSRARANERTRLGSTGEGPIAQAPPRG